MSSVWRCGCLGYSRSLEAPQVLWILTLLCSLIAPGLEDVTTALKEKTEALSLGQSYLSSVQRDGEGVKVYRSFCNKDQVVGISKKDYCLLKKTRYL